MPDVNYIVSSLPDYVKNNAELISKQLAFGPRTIDRITIQTGVKYKEQLNFLSVSAPIQDGAGCGFNASGSATLTKRDIVTARMKKELSICPDTLVGYWPEYLVSIPADKRDELPFEAYLVELLVDETNKDLETLIWQGATSTYSGTDLIDGFLTIAANEADVIDVSIADNASCFDAVKAMISNAPKGLIREGYKVFVDEEFFTQLSFELMEKNLYHYAPSENEDSIKFPGTNVEVYSTPGLNNSGYMLGSVKKNMYYGTDESDAERRVKIVYSEKDDDFAVKFRWNSGVQFAFPDWVVLGALPSGGCVSPAGDAALATIAAGVDALAGAYDSTNKLINVKDNAS